MREQKIHGTPQGMNEQSNPGGLGQPRGQGGQQLPGHEISQTGPGQYTADQMTLGDVTDPSPGHHQPRPARTRCPARRQGPTSRIPKTDKMVWPTRMTCGKVKAWGRSGKSTRATGAQLKTYQQPYMGGLKVIAWEASK